MSNGGICECCPGDKCPTCKKNISTAAASRSTPTVTCPICECCPICKGECKAKCKNNKACHIVGGCECCEVCKGPCKCPNKICHEYICICPCINDDGTRMNPLSDLNITPSGGWNYKGGTFGKNNRSFKDRNDVIHYKDHDGVDFKADVGTPINAVASGIVTQVEKGQKEKYRDPNTNRLVYPEGFKGDGDGSGNRVHIMGDDGIEYVYWHLQYGSNSSINEGERVKMGAIIGKVGRTGNAAETISHLHLGTRKDGIWKDPTDYIPASIGSDYSVTTPCD